MASYRTVTVTATIATNTVTANGEVSEHIFMADADGQQVIVTDPYVAVESVDGGVLLTVRDAHEETQAVIANGQKGDKGDNGFSPTATVTKSGSVATIAITDENGTTTATVEDGSNDWNDLQNIPKMITNVTVTGGDGEVDVTRSYNDGTFEGSIAEISGYVYTGTYGAHTLKLKRKNVPLDITVFTADTTPTSGSDQLVTSGGVYEALAAKGNKVTSLSSSSTDTQYPSAKCVYDLVGNIETLLASI